MATSTSKKENETLVILSIHGAKGLPKMDTIGSVDPFVQITFGAQLFKTKVIKKDKSPVWNQDFVIVVLSHEQKYTITMEILDFDKVGSAEHVAKYECPIDELMSLCASDQKETKMVDLNHVKGGECQFVFSVQKIDAQDLQKTFWTKIMEIYDYDHNGKINVLELHALLEGIGCELSDSQLIDLVECSDRNGDKEMDINELQELMASCTKTSTVKFTKCPICSATFPSGADPSDLVLHFGACFRSSPVAASDFAFNSLLLDQCQPKESLDVSSLTDKMTGFLRSESTGMIGHSGAKVEQGQIMVMQRETGKLVEEKIPPYIRLSMRAMYASAVGKKAMDLTKAAKLLSHMTREAGKKYEDPKSKSEIQPFIAYHNLDMSEYQLPAEVHSNFNEFFYRTLKAGARVIAEPENPDVAVCPADARTVAFDSIDDAKTFWVKGEQFSLSTLLQHPELTEEFQGCRMVISRLAPQDYHRFHCPCDATVESIRPIDGVLYTVNPIAIRKNVDVLSGNKRVVCVLNTPSFGRVIFIAVGATLVGSIEFTAKEGDQVKKGDELGFFKFGGSTVITLWKPQALELAHDIKENSKVPVETLCRMGSLLGHAPHH